MSLSFGHGSSAGRVRGSNQDYHRVRAYGTPSGGIFFFALADGMGGTAAGDRASKIAIEVMSDALDRYTALLNEGRPAIALENALARAAKAANKAIQREAETNPQRDGMGTTLTNLVVHDWKAAIVHVGDSRAYLARGGRLRQLTRDHSWVAEQVELGYMTPEEASHHQHRNLLVRAVGLRSELEPDSFALAVEPGDTFILTSDGLHSLVSEEEMLGELKRGGSLQSAAEYWISLAERRGGHDNMTVVIAQVAK
jgi:protein phosphatase